MFTIHKSNMFSPKYCQDIIEHIDTIQLSKGKVGPGEGTLNEDIRITQTDNWRINEERNEFERTLSLEIWRIFSILNLDLRIDIDPKAIVLNYTKYDKNGKYDFHNDSDFFVLGQSSNTPTFGNNYNRKLSMGILLQSAKSGGKFVIKSDNEEIKFLYNVGDLVLFPSFYSHRVYPIKEGIRYSIVIWFHGPGWK